MGKDVACPRNAARLLVAGWVVRPWRSSQPGKSLGCYAKEPEFTLQVLKKHLQFLPAKKKKTQSEFYFQKAILVTVYSLDILLSLFGTSLLFHVQF